MRANGAIRAPFYRSFAYAPQHQPYMGNGIKRLLPQLQSPQVAADRSRERMKTVALVATSAAPIPAQNHQRR